MAPIDPLIAEASRMRADVIDSCELALTALGISPMSDLVDGLGTSPVLSTAQALLIRPYELAIPAVIGVQPEDVPQGQERERLLEHPQAFVEATVGVLQAFYEKQLRDNPTAQPTEPVAPITIENAIAIGSMFANPTKLPEKSQSVAGRMINESPAARVVFNGLKALQKPTPAK